MKKKAINLLSVILITSLVACGGDAKKSDKKSDSMKEESKTETSTEAATQEAPSEMEEVEKEKEVVEIKLAASGEDMTAIAYEPKSLSVPAGSRVKLTFENKSQAAGMYHNFVLVKLGTGQEIATAGIQAGKENEFIPQSDLIYAYTEVVDMGKTVTIEFDAPPKGSYHYICTYPGHYPNMIGRLNVE